MQRPRIKRTAEPLSAPNGDLILMQPSRDFDVTIEQPSERDKELVDALDGKHSLAELEAQFGAGEVSDLISQLQSFGVLEDAADDDCLDPAELARFDRQLRYFSDIGDPDLTPSERQDRLREAKVAVLGVGGLGGSAALWLACTGIGEMWLIDGDEVEISNLNRQVLYAEADVGAEKVGVAAARLLAFNSAMTITADERRLESEGELADFIAGADVVIDAADWPAHEIERWCNSACFELGIPYITMSHSGPFARVGPLYVPGETGCFICQEIGYRREFPLLDAMVDQQRARPSPAATLGPPCGLIGGQVGMEVVHLLTGLVRPATQGVAHVYDMRTMEVKREQVVPEPECPVCGHLQSAERAAVT